MDILILAGGKTSPELCAHTGVEQRALLEVNGERFIDCVLGAIRPLGNPIMVADFELPGIHRVAAGKSFVESLGNGLSAVSSDHFLLVTADIPKITTEAVEHFLDNSDRDALMNFPILRAEDCERQFPGMARTTLKLREGTFTGGNIGFVNTAMMRASLPVLDRAYAARKQPLRLAGLLGVPTLARLVLGKVIPKSLKLSQLEADVARFLHGKVKAVISPYPELGADIDDLEQYLALLALENPA